MKGLIVSFCLCLLLSGCAREKMIEGISAQVKRVVSGQTIEVLIDNQPTIVRLSGLDAPNLNYQPWGELAQQTLIKLLTDNYQQTLTQVKVTIETNSAEKDAYNRLYGYVWKEGKLINQQLIAQGQALANLNYTEGKYDQQLILAQDYARIMGQGIWNPQNPLRELTITRQQSTINSY
jgi:micrococcal nuclease